MSGEQVVVLDWLSEMWGVQYYRVVIAMVLFWLIYLKVKIACLVDFGWSFNHCLLGVSLFLTNCLSTIAFKPVVFLILLIFWFLRLGGFLLKYRILPGHEDPRYQKLQDASSTDPRLYFFIQYQFQGFLVMWTGTPLYFVFRDDSNLGPNFYVAVVLIIVGILGEAIADQQLEDYKARKKAEKKLKDSMNTNMPRGPPEIFAEGLWKKSRHPNLFFELMVWTGFAVGGLNDYISIIGFLGPVLLFLVMDCLTLPLTEKHMKDSRGLAYTDFCKKTNKYIPI